MSQLRKMAAAALAQENRGNNANRHTHPANSMTRSVSHTHPNGVRKHGHKYGK